MVTPEGIYEVVSERPTSIRFKTPKKQPRFMRPKLEKEVDGKAHTVRFIGEYITIDGKGYDQVTTIDGLKRFMVNIHPGYYQASCDAAMVLTSVLSDNQRNDLKNTRECDLGGGDKLLHMRNKLVYKEKHGERYRNYVLTNAMPFNGGKEVSEDQIVISQLKLAWKLEESGLYLPGAASNGGISRSLVIDKAEDAYFPVWMLEREEVVAFYATVKGPDFRAFSIGDTLDCIDNDIVNCYPSILEYSVSARPGFCSHFQSVDYQPEAAYAAVKIWVNLDALELLPLGVRIQKTFFDKDYLYLPRNKVYIVHPWGNIRSVWVGMPMLWFLIEKLGLELGKDIGILDGWWVVPEGRKIHPWREWSRLTIQAAKNFPELKFVNQIGITGGTFLKKTKVGEGEYEGNYEALSTENPIYLSHLFEMTKILVLLGSSQSENIKGFAADGWVSKGRVPSTVGPVKIGAVTYGPFLVRNTPLELYYQFDPVRHDMIEDREREKGFWRPMVEANPKKKKLDYSVLGTVDYPEAWDNPKIIGSEVERHFSWEASHGENIPDSLIEEIGDTLGNELGSKPPHTTQIESRLPYLREELLAGVKWTS